MSASVGIRSAAIQAYRESESEKRREANLIQLVPRGRTSVLDIGARDGHYSRLLTRHFSRVVALDLAKPRFEYPGVETVAGDITRLSFPENHFDCVFCTEVLEHIVNIEKACSEIVRVARHEVIIGVPYRQDIRLGRTTCAACGGISPPYGHVNSFDERRLRYLFRDLRFVSQSFAGSTRNVTTGLAALLMNLAGNPWGTYDQEEGCIHCGAKLAAPVRRSFWSRSCSGVAARMNNLQQQFTPVRGNWIHMLFAKDA